MERWIIKTTMDEVSIEKETKELGKEFERIKAVVFAILGNHPIGITEVELLAKLPEGVDKQAVQNIMSFLVIEQTVETIVAYRKV